MLTKSKNNAITEIEKELSIDGILLYVLKVGFPH